MAPPNPEPECRHAQGVLEVATPAGVRTFHDVKIWPQGETLIVLLPRGERVAFRPGMWSAAHDRCAACGRELAITPTTIARKAGKAA